MFSAVGDPTQLQDDASVGLVGTFIGGPVLCVGHGNTRLFMQGGLIAFDGEQIVSSLVEYLAGNLALATHCINANQQPLQVQGFKQYRDGGDFIALVADTHSAPRPSPTPWQRHRPCVPVQQSH